MCRVTSPQVRPTRSLRRNAPANPINSKAVGTYNNDGVGSNVRCQSLISATWAFQPFAGSFVGFLGAWAAETCLVRASYRREIWKPTRHRREIWKTDAETWNLQHQMH